MRWSGERWTELERRLREGESRKSLMAAGYPTTMIYRARKGLGTSKPHVLPAAVSQEIRRLRLEQNLSAPEIAQALGISHHSVYKYTQDIPWDPAQRLPREHHYSVAEISALYRLYPTAPVAEIRAVLRNRRFDTIVKKANALGLRRELRLPQPEGLPRVIAELWSAREQAGLDRTDLARLMGVYPPSLCNWEFGKAKPTIGNLIKWAAALGFEVTLAPKATP